MTFWRWLRSLFRSIESEGLNSGSHITTYDQFLRQERQRLYQVSHDLLDTWRFAGTPVPYLRRLKALMDRMENIRYYALVDQEREMLAISRDLAILIADYTGHAKNHA